MKEPETLRGLQRRYASTALLVSVVAAAACIGVGYPAIGKGLIVGTLISIVNFVLIGRSLPKRLEGTKRVLMAKSFSSLCLRYGIMAAGLYAGIALESLNFFAVAAGLFSVQAVILADHVAAARRNRS
ncbi:MAG: ATP synthase subunit I [Thermodesulfobacteriota bacterium]